jgi:hypothetical protein
VLIPAACPPRSAYSIDVVGQALVAKARGAGHRSIASRLDMPASTVRGWLRMAGRGAEPLRRRATELLSDFDPDPPPLEPTGSPLGDALTALAAAALAAAALAAVRRLGDPGVALWHLVAVLAGRLVPAACARRAPPPASLATAVRQGRRVGRRGGTGLAAPQGTRPE